VFYWLFEGELAVYLALATVGVLFLGLWWGDRKKHWLLACAGVGVLIGLYFLLDMLVETSQEQIRNSLRAMARAIKEQKPDDFLAHVSSELQMDGVNKQQFGAGLALVLREPLVEDLSLRAFSFTNWPPPQGQPATVVFYTKVKAVRAPDGSLMDGDVRCEAEFVREPDNKWRLKALRVFQQLDNMPISLRGYLY
jgi:hypothetical protein